MKEDSRDRSIELDFRPFGMLLAKPSPFHRAGQVVKALRHLQLLLRRLPFEDFALGRLHNPA
jgi:hypothetical protein